MKHSLADGSGSLVIDHTASPGLTPQDVAHLPGMVAVPGGVRHERDIQMCTHCQRGVILEPLRTRPRGYCPKCDHYLCDACEAIRARTNECLPFLQRLDAAQTLLESARGDLQSPAFHPRLILTDAADRS